MHPDHVLMQILILQSLFEKMDLLLRIVFLRRLVCEYMALCS